MAQHISLDMSGRRVLITGASSGIGRAMAATFAAAGAELVLLDVDEEVASVALCLASDLASYVHGATIAADGGFLSA